MFPFGFGLLEDVVLLAWEPYFRARKVLVCMSFKGRDDTVVIYTEVVHLSILI